MELAMDNDLENDLNYILAKGEIAAHKRALEMEKEQWFIDAIEEALESEDDPRGIDEVFEEIYANIRKRHAKLQNKI